jgi:hypothetical protein
VWTQQTERLHVKKTRAIGRYSAATVMTAAYVGAVTKEYIERRDGLERSPRQPFSKMLTVAGIFVALTWVTAVL